MKEFFDKVDHNDRVLGKINRYEAHQLNIRHRAVHIFVQDTRGLWLMQKRSSRKDLDPLKWTTSCSGHVDAGESYIEAAERECVEELGINMSRNDLREIFRCSPCTETGAEFVRVYVAGKQFTNFTPDVSEIAEIDFYSVLELSKKCKEEEQIFSGSFLHLFRFVAPRLINYSRDS